MVILANGTTETVQDLEKITEPITEIMWSVNNENIKESKISNMDPIVDSAGEDNDSCISWIM